MPRLSDHTPEEVDKWGGLDHEIRSPTSPLLLVAAAVGSGALAAFTAHSAFLVWVRLKPKPSSVLALLDTVGLGSVGTWANALVLYFPNVVLMGAIAFLIGWFFPRVFVRLTTAFVIAESLTELTLEGTTPWWSMLGRARIGDYRGAFGYVVMTVLVYGIPFSLAWIASRYTNRGTREGHCSKCGYLLKGLPTRRCPECGEPF
jgi:hypothetical protein